MAGAVPVLAQDGGYSGLIAPPSAPETSAPEPESGTADPSPVYEGLLAPPPAAPASRSGKGGGALVKEEPPGYSGVIPGYVGGRPGGGKLPAEDKPLQVTATPGLDKFLPSKTSADLKAPSVILEKPGRVSAKMARTLAKPSARINDMLPMEYVARETIDQLMPGVRDKKLPAAVRAENIRQAHARLATLADGLRYRKMVPDKTYREMGLPDVFIKEEREGADKALLRLNRALTELKEY